MGYICFNAPLRLGRDWTDCVVVNLHRATTHRRRVCTPNGEFGRFYFNRRVTLRQLEVTNFPHTVTDVVTN